MDQDNEMESNAAATIEDVDMDESDSDSESDDENEEDTKNKEVYLPGMPLEDGEELVCDESAYIMLHQAQTGAPCLSFDIIRDELGESRPDFPMTAYIVAGTQAASAHVNNVIVMKISNMDRTSREKDSDSESEEEEDEEFEKPQVLPKMDCALIKHDGCVNRIRSTRMGNSVFAASWSELGRVNIWNLDTQLQAIDDSNLLKKYEKEKKAEITKPIFSFGGHQQEGFAMDWNPVNAGVLATGDCRRDIHIWQPTEASSWNVDQRPLIGHRDSVEDLQWSPNERTVLASCSVDKSIRIWDTRAGSKEACMLTCEDAHTSDINVISWNRNEAVIASGGDDGVVHIWDLRLFQHKKPVASFKHHISHITTVEWHPTEKTVFASGGADDQVALWDLALEKDDDANGDESKNETEVSNLPPQLLFIHQGQKDIKELHWHPQLPGVLFCTAHSGFNIFKSISV